MGAQQARGDGWRILADGDRDNAGITVYLLQCQEQIPQGHTVAPAQTMRIGQTPYFVLDDRQFRPAGRVPRDAGSILQPTTQPPPETRPR
jgi:hypothetical protein